MFILGASYYKCQSSKKQLPSPRILTVAAGWWEMLNSIVEIVILEHKIFFSTSIFGISSGTNGA